MNIIEIEIQLQSTRDRAAHAKIIVDGSEYLLVACSSIGSITVIAGRWINDRRALGKTFFSAGELQAHYKKHGKVLVEYANRLTTFRKETPSCLSDNGSSSPQYGQLVAPRLEPCFI